jgi:hypothetical protein
MTNRIKHLVESQPFHHAIVAVNRFIGIIMYSMSEMHAEIAARARAEHERETGAATLGDELKALEAELKATQTRLTGLRRKWIGGTKPERKLEEVAA